MTPITQWIPERWRQNLAHLRDDIHHALDRWWHRQGDYAESHTGALVPEVVDVDQPSNSLWSPPRFIGGGLALDVEETDDEVRVIADLPGLERDDFHVEIAGERLVIRGEKKQESSRKGHGYSYAERRYSAFSRSLPLPYEVDADKAEAVYKNGELRLTLPKTAGAKASRVKVQVNT